MGRSPGDIVDSLLRDPRARQPKTVWIDADGDATDVAADELERAAGSVRGADGGAGFFLQSGRLRAFAKVWGDPWALHRALEQWRRISAALPDRTFGIDSEERGVSGALRAGVYRSAGVDALAAWVAEFPSPDLTEQRFSRLALSCTVSDETGDDIEDETAALGDLGDGASLEVRRSDGRIAIAAWVDDAQDAWQLARLFGRVAGCMRGELGWRCELAFAGDGRTWQREIDGDAVELEAVRLVVARGLPAPDLSAPRAARTTQTPASLDDVGAVVGDEALVLRSDHGAYRLSSSGELMAVPVVLTTSDDRRRAIEIVDDEHVVVVDRATGGRTAVVPVRAGRRPIALGFVGPWIVLGEIALRFGRTQWWFSVHGPEGETFSSGPYVNVRRPVLDVDGERLVFLAEIDGAPTLVAVAIPSCERARTLAVDRDVASGELVCVGGDCYAVATAGAVGAVLQLGPTELELFALLPGRASLEPYADSGGIVVVVRHQPDIGGPTHDVVRVDCATARVDCLTEPDALGPDRIDHLVRCGAWLALAQSARRRIVVFEAGRLVREHGVPGDHIGPFAISATGALAASIDGERLFLARGSDVVIVPSELAPAAWE